MQYLFLSDSGSQTAHPYGGCCFDVPVPSHLPMSLTLVCRESGGKEYLMQQYKEWLDRESRSALWDAEACGRIFSAWSRMWKEAQRGCRRWDGRAVLSGAALLICPGRFYLAGAGQMRAYSYSRGRLSALYIPKRDLQTPCFLSGPESAGEIYILMADVPGIDRKERRMIQILSGIRERAGEAEKLRGLLCAAESIRELICRPAPESIFYPAALVMRS